MTQPKGADQTYIGKITREKILAIIRRDEMTGHFPTVREIGDSVGLRSSSTVHNHLQHLRREGRITMSRFNSRSIRYVKKPEEVCTCCGGNGFGYIPKFPDVPGTELIGNKRSPEETSFGH